MFSTVVFYKFFKNDLTSINHGLFSGIIKSIIITAYFFGENIL